MSAAEDKDKLKELEESLAEELDQDIKLAEPTDARLSEDVHLNPNIPAPEEEKQEVTDEVSTGDEGGTTSVDVDTKIPASETDGDEAELDEEELARRKAQEEVEQSLALIDQAEDLPGPGPKKADPFASLKQNFTKVGALLTVPFRPVIGVINKVFEKPIAVVRGLYGRFPDFRQNAKKYLVKFVKEDSKKLLAFSISKGKVLITFFKEKIKIFLGLKLAQKLQFLFILVMVVLTFFVAKYMIKDTFIPEMKEKYVSDLQDVAGKNTEVAKDELLEDYKSPMRHPEYMLLIDKITVNLKPDSSSSKNPMLFFEVFLNASSQEGAVELKVRLPEVRDSLQRASESFKYEELKGIEGKKRLKIAMKQELNKFLNNGTVTEIYFNTFILKF